MVIIAIGGCGSPTFEDVDKGKIPLWAEEKNAITELIMNAGITSDEFDLYEDLSQYNYAKGYFKIVIKDNHVRALTLIGQSLQQMEPIAALTELQDLNLSGNKIKVIRGLEESIKLRKLDLGNNRINQTKGLRGCRSLEILYLNDNELTVIPDLNEFPHLKDLNLSHNLIISLEELQKGKNLTSLSLRFNKLTSVSGISNLPQLAFLYLNDNQITSLKGLDGLPKLVALDLSKNKLTSVDELQKFPVLYYVDLRSNNITQLPKFAKELRELKIKGNPVAKDMDMALEMAGQPIYKVETGRVTILPSGSGTLSGSGASKYKYTYTSGILGNKKRFHTSKNGLSLSGKMKVSVLPDSFSGSLARIKLSVSFGKVRVYLKAPGTYKMVKDRFGNKKLQYSPESGYVYSTATPGHPCVLVGNLLDLSFNGSQIFLEAVKGSARGISYEISDTQSK
jgi:hypothetical protein